MAVLHGVKRIAPCSYSSTVQLPEDDSRLGVLMWQTRNPPGGDVATVSEAADLDGVNHVVWGGGFRLMRYVDCTVLQVRTFDFCIDVPSSDSL